MRWGRGSGQNAPGPAGPARRPARRPVAALAGASLAVVGALALAAALTTVLRAPGRPAHAPPGPAPAPAPAVPHTAGPSTASAPPASGLRAVVMGDSTAAGAGLPPVHHASPADRACGRSAASAARDMAANAHWRVVNLACGGATIPRGILGTQITHGVTVPAQLTRARRIPGVSVVIVTVGADDLDWASTLLNCALSAQCGGAGLFRQRLAAFRGDYHAMLTALAGLPGHPAVIINQYYDPFGRGPDCLSMAGLTPAKLRVLGSRLAALNAVLAGGASRQGFTTVHPDFAGHQLCSHLPYVQGMLARAPFHPTAAGQAAIARADEAAVRAPAR